MKTKIITWTLIEYVVEFNGQTCVRVRNAIADTGNKVYIRRGNMPVGESVVTLAIRNIEEMEQIGSDNDLLDLLCPDVRASRDRGFEAYVLRGINADELKRGDIISVFPVAQKESEELCHLKTFGNEKFRHGSRIHSMVFAPDNRHLFTISNHGIIRVWDILTGECECVIENQLTIAIHPKRNQFAAFTLDGSIQVRSLETYQTIKIIQTTEAFDLWISPVYTEGGEHLLYTTDTGGINICDIEKGTCSVLIKSGKIEKTYFCYVPEKNIMITGTTRSGINILALDTLETLHHLPGNYIKGLLYSHALERIAVLNAAEVIIYDLNGQELYRHSCMRTAFVLTVDQKYLVTAERHRLQALSLETFERRQVFETEAYEDILDLAYSPNGKYLASSNFPQSMYIMNLETGERLNRYEGHINQMYSVSFHPNGKELISSSADFHFITCDKATGEYSKFYQKRVVSIPSVEKHRFVMFDSTGDNLIYANERRINVRRWPNGRGNRHIIEIDTEIYPFCISPDDNHIAYCKFGDKNVFVINLKDGKTVRMFRFDIQTPYFTILKFTNDGKHLVTIISNEIQKWSIEDGDCKFRQQIGMVVWTGGNCLDIYDNLIAVPAEKHNIMIWDSCTNRIKRKLAGHTARIICIRFIMDGKYLVSSGDDQTLRLWHVGDEELLSSIRVRPGVVINDISIWNNEVALACSDGLLRIYKIHTE